MSQSLSIYLIRANNRSHDRALEMLSEKVYECTLAVEAHMICDLLARAVVSARVDGEFLAGAGGDLPLGNTVKVRVDPARAAEARDIIADWEKLQPPEPIRPREDLLAFTHVVLRRLAGRRRALYLVSQRRDQFPAPIMTAMASTTRPIITWAACAFDRYDSNADGKVDVRWSSRFTWPAERNTTEDRGFRRPFRMDDRIRTWVRCHQHAR